MPAAAKIYTSGSFSRTLQGTRNIEDFVAYLPELYKSSRMPVLTESKFKIKGDHWLAWPEVSKRAPEFYDIALEDTSEQEAPQRGRFGQFAAGVPQKCRVHPEATPAGGQIDSVDQPADHFQKRVPSRLSPMLETVSLGNYHTSYSQWTVLMVDMGWILFRPLLNSFYLGSISFRSTNYIDFSPYTSGPKGGIMCILAVSAEHGRSRTYSAPPGQKKTEPEARPQRPFKSTAVQKGPSKIHPDDVGNY